MDVFLYILLGVAFVGTISSAIFLGLTILGYLQFGGKPASHECVAPGGTISSGLAAKAGAWHGSAAEREHREFFSTGLPVILSRYCSPRIRKMTPRWK